MPIVIHFPKEKVDTPKKFLAGGTAPRSVKGVKGFVQKLVDGKPTGEEVDGLLLSYRFRKVPDEEGFYSWTILFRDGDGFDPGNYRLTVAPLVGSVAPATRDFKAVAREHTEKQRGITVVHPPSGNITGEAGSLVAWGTLSEGHQATQARMNDIPADNIEMLGRALWTAHFPPLGSGIYTLVAVDSGNHSQAVENLVVN